MLHELEPLATTPAAYAFAVVFGLLWGSFANVCIYRWPPTKEHPKGRSVVAPGSHCFACQAPIRWYDNVPLLSWLWLRGRCRACKASFSGRYLIVEAVTGLLFGVAWFAAIEGFSLAEPLEWRLARFGVYAAFCFVVVVISFIDLDHKLILDKITLPSIVIFYALGLVIGRSWHAGLIGAAVGYGLPWSIGEIYFLVAEREGLGLGDSKLLAVVGALLGVQGVIASLFGGAMVGAIVGVLVLMRSQGGGKSPASAIVAVIAVAGTVAATVLALRGAYLPSLIGCIVAVAALVISRRLEPPIEDDAPEEPVEEAPPEVVGGKRLAIRVLALVAGAGVITALMCALLAWLIAAGIAAVVGVGLLLVARRLAGPIEYVDESPPEPEDDAPSLMRTELPFGPFLALAATFYLFAEPWVILQFRMLL